MNWDVYELPDVKMLAERVMNVALITFCNANLQDVGGRQALESFTFEQFGLNKVELFNAGLILLHVNEVYKFF
jgi:hypothetical protein